METRANYKNWIPGGMIAAMGMGTAALTAGVFVSGSAEETLRVLKKGGVFAIHDLMSPARYGDMKSFVEFLRQKGYERVELIPTASGLFLSSAEARWLLLRDSIYSVILTCKSL